VLFLDLVAGSGMGEKLNPGSGINILDSESLETIFWFKKNLNSLMRIRIRIF
jgi:hypothetical protein